MKILFIDTETGGLIPEKHSLLSIGLVFWEDGALKATKEFFLKEEKYIVDESAMLINGINLSELKEKGKSKSSIKQELVFFIKEHFKNEKVYLGGHNVSFDIAFMKQLFTLDEFNSLFSYKNIDTMSILKFLSLKGVCDSNSLDEAIEYFGVENIARHSALGDAIITAKLFTILLGE